jgi:hypothetical protein
MVDGEVAVIMNKYLMRYLGFALVKVNASDIHELRTLVERLAKASASYRTLEDFAWTHKKLTALRKRLVRDLAAQAGYDYQDPEGWFDK